MKILESISDINLFLLTILRNIKHNLKHRKISVSGDMKESIHLLGNGPSLCNTIEYVGKLGGCTCMCNKAADSELFWQVKPEYFIMVDPLFYTDSKNEKFWKVLEGVDWDIHFLYNADYAAKVNKLKNTCIIKEPISVITHMSNSDKLDFTLYRRGWGAPVGRTVMQTAIYYAIQAGFKKIYVHGLDFDYKYIIDNNVVYMIDNHYYEMNDEETRVRVDGFMDIKEGEYWKVLLNDVQGFRGFDKLNKYAITQNAQIINMSSISQVDAFERFHY